MESFSIYIFYNINKSILAHLHELRAYQKTADFNSSNVYLYFSASVSLVVKRFITDIHL